MRLRNCCALIHTHTNTQLHQCEQVSVQTIVEVCECSGFVSVSVWWFGGRKKKKFSSDLRFLLGDNTQEIPSNPSGLQLGTHYTVFKCQTSSLHADNEERARAPARYVNQTLLVLFKRASNFEKLHHFLAFFFFLRRSFRHEPNGRSRERVSQMLQGGKGKDWEKFRGDFGLNTLVRCAQARCGSVWRQLCLLFPDCWVIARLCAFGDVVNPVPDVLSAGCSHQL